MKRGLKKVLAITTTSLVGLTGLVGVMHMPFARSLLMRVGGCPIVRGTPEQIEEAQRKHAERNRALATSDAPMRPALGFTLEKTTPDEVHDWASNKNLSCTDDLDGTVVQCLDVPASAIGQNGPNYAEIQFAFHVKPRLLKIVSTFRQNLSHDQAVALVETRQDELGKDLGKPALERGTPALDMSGKAGAVYIASYNFKDYLADQNATQIGNAFSISEHFISQQN